MDKLFGNIYNNKKVMITGHTGFKGSWLALWLQHLQAQIVGYSLEPPTNPNHFSLLDIDIQSIIGDIRDKDHLDKVFVEHKPDIVFHMAAQPLVRLSYQTPIETYQTNVIGTLHVLEACKKTDSVQAIINITSDKCYDNKEWVWGYRESDPMGGYDPYSSSKGCAELLTSSYRNSFFNLKDYGSLHHTLLASARAGNVIGGGDWAEDRLMPDIVKTTNEKKTVKIRNPQSIRPWQHVLEPLSGYLLLGQKLLEGEKEYAQGWNFGPGMENPITVGEVVELMKRCWDKIKYTFQSVENASHEANLLNLDCSKAFYNLNWKSIWNCNKAVEETSLWYKAFYDVRNISSVKQLKQYVQDAKNASVEWAK